MSIGLGCPFLPFLPLSCLVVITTAQLLLVLKRALLLTGDCPMADVAARVDVFPSDAVSQAVGAFLCLSDRCAERDSAEYASAAGDYTIAIEFGARMKNFRAGVFLRVI